MSSRVFKNVGALRPGRSLFDLSYEKKFTCDFGQLIPVMCDEVVPGDFFQIGNQSIVRFQPLVAPVLHEVNMYVHYFFVPYRILWDAKTREELTETGDWESFITGGFDGLNADTIPTWNPVSNAKGSLWDYLGFPVSKDPAAGSYPIDFPRRAYNRIFNEYYMDENVMTAVAIDNEDILYRCWEKDYFTSSLPWQQRGTAPALPIAGYSQAEYAASSFLAASAGSGVILYAEGADAVSPELYLGAGNSNARQNMEDLFNNNTVDLSTASTFDIADIRLAFQIQKWLERNARAGVRYTEFLRGHFDVSPRDDRLQRPEYIGGSRVPVIFSEVLQTESSDASTPQGNLAGHGISVSNQYCGKVKVKEYGLIMGLMSIMPRTDYQDGINRQWLKETKYDFFFPEFENLSEQAVLNNEIFITDGNAATNKTIFGYQGRYDELRTKQNIICSDMRDTFDYWHISRQFSSVPSLNEAFLKCDPRKDIFASPAEPGMIVRFANVIKAFRPISITAEPGLIDHN